MKKNTIFILIIIALAVGLMWLGRKSQSASPSQIPTGNTKSSLTALETFYNFGTISMANGKVNKLFEITNSTGQEVNLERVITSCMCTAAYIVSANGEKGPFGMPGHLPVPKANEILKAGETRTIKVVYDPAAHGPAGVGPIDRFIYLTDSSGGTLELEIKALVTP